MDSGWKIQRNVIVPSQEVPRRDDIAVIDSLEYHGEWMGDEYLAVSVKSSVPVDFEFGDFVYYRGEYYYLNYDPNVVKKARSGSYGEGFTYDNIKLYAVSRDISTTDFKDVVLEDNQITYTSLSEFTFFAGSVEDLADRLQANLDRREKDFKVLTPNWLKCQQRGITQSEWESIYDDSATYGTWGSGEGVTLGETDINISVSKDDNCWVMLGKAYSEFGLSFYTKENYIVIGAPAVKPGHIFRYGKNNGLYEVERTSDEDQELVTKLWGYGSTENLPLNYYANIGKRPFIIGSKYTETGLSGYYVRTSITYASIKEAIPNVANPAVILTNSTGLLSCTAYLSSYRSSNVDYVQVNLSDSVWINGETIQSETSPADFFAAIANGERLYIVYGASASSWPDDYVEKPEDYNYPALLSVNRLMLPGFPLMTLDEWLRGVADGSIIGGDAGGLTAAEASELLGKYDFSGKDVDPSEAELYGRCKLDPFVVSKNMDEDFSYEGSVFFDASSSKEIMPSIENTDAGTVQVGSVISDNGWLPEDMPDNDSRKSFQIKVLKNSLNWLDVWNKRDSGSDVVLSMTSGNCAGREFKMKSKPVAGEGNQSVYWILTLNRTQDESGRWWPYQESGLTSFANIVTGDTFVVTGINLPDEYVIAASVKLLFATCGWLDKRDHMRYTYVPKVDEIYMARQDEAVKLGRDANIYGTVSLHDTLKAGMCLQMEDTDLGIERFGGASPYIDQLTIRETGGAVPTYDVVLRDEKEKGFKEQIAEQLSDLSKDTTPATERQNRQHETADRGEWKAGDYYYYETLNPTSGFIETSRVTHFGLTWECHRTGTNEPPHYGAQDWVVVGTPTLDVRIWNKNSYDLLFQDEVRDDFADGATYQMQMRVYHGEEDVTLNGSDSQRFYYALSRDDGNAGFAQAYSRASNGVSLPSGAVFGGMVTIDGTTYDMRRWTRPTRPGEHAMAVVSPVGTVSVTISGAPEGYVVNAALLTLDKAIPRIEDSGAWVDSGDYHANSAIISQAWNYGILWQCDADGTHEEPSFGCNDWTPVGGNNVLSLGALSSRGYMFRRGAVDTTITPYLYFGNEEISAKVAAENWNWTRTSEHPTPDSTTRDQTWNAAHSHLKTLELSNTDMDITWSSVNKQIFTLTISVNDGNSTVIVENQIIS